ncbi:hypothetical protein RZR97_10200 [Hydrogenimonas thermophila]|uniref:hypothetical protein n=1 Tax=Hydrogenimonas thermophila TaxID=223786 RepID=UPI002936D7B8|nr:hypothetical protein [Hydrogenimonas thermophila]WOE69471.1 hypothetical protein RZR91_10225 [Hydrogenimonas thermophila]WOE71982.1 hypothetical protein RZR97_10200 [Hydrogenimonas thermophila]
MKKLMFFILLSIFAFGSMQEIEQKICNKILLSIFKEKRFIKVWYNSKNHYKNLKDKKFLFVEIPDQADILIVDHYEEILADKPIFVKKYHLLRKYKNRAIGGFYWQKGRPNIIFLKSNLQKYNIKLPDEFSRYVEENR